MGSLKSLVEDVEVESVDNSGYLSRIPDVILPSQFFELVGARTFSSEQRLMLAILPDAINVLGIADSSNLRKRNSFKEPASWVIANGITSPLSVDTASHALSINT